MGLLSRISPWCSCKRVLRGCDKSSVTPSHRYLTASLKKIFHRCRELTKKSNQSCNPLLGSTAATRRTADGVAQARQELRRRRRRTPFCLFAKPPIDSRVVLPRAQTPPVHA